MDEMRRVLDELIEGFGLGEDRALRMLLEAEWLAFEVRGALSECKEAESRAREALRETLVCVSGDEQ